jgi:hypothetical protein
MRFDDTGDGTDKAGTVVTDDGENKGCHGATLPTAVGAAELSRVVTR